MGMTPLDFIEIIREGIYVLMLISAPTMLAAMIVGLAISLLQALTQIQETTLTFVPKMVAVLLSLVIAMPFMLDRLTEFTNRMSEKIVHIEE
jgi:flagellar biosynthetic protein FliQ